MFPNVLQKGKKGMFTGPKIQELLQSLELKKQNVFYRKERLTGVYVGSKWFPR
jgi:hypothetical protein